MRGEERSHGTGIFIPIGVGDGGKRGMCPKLGRKRIFRANIM